LKVGKDYCEKNKYKYIEKNDDIEESKQMNESEIITIALDGSGSMNTFFHNDWNNVVEGTKSLIEYIN